MGKRVRLVLVVIVMLLATVSVWAQGSTSSITGTVKDASGAVVPGAKIEVKNEATGSAYSGATTGAGTYAFPSLTPGLYTVTVSLQGFQTLVSAHNVLTVGQPLVVDASLIVGAPSTVVQVSGSYERVNTMDATISDIVTEQQVKQLPLNGRNPLSLLTLEPGVVQRTNSNTGSGTHVFGSRDRAHNVTIDGIDANESTVPNPQSNLQRLTPDNVQEIRTVTLGATAEEGRNSGANMMIATKAGTNGYHGDVVFFNRNRDYNSNEWFNNYNGQPRPDLKFNQWGFDVGGPIRKDKTFFFFSYQGNELLQTEPIAQAYGTPSVYTSSMRNGNFRFVRGTVTANGKSYSRNSPNLVDGSGNLLPGVAPCSVANNYENCVDTYNIFANDPLGIGGDPGTMALIKSTPLPNNFAAAGDGLNMGGFSWNPPTKFTGPFIMVRVDHAFGSKDSIFGRWLQNSYNTTEGDFANARPQLFPGFPPLGESLRLGRNLAISYRHTFSPTLVNELTMGFNRFGFTFTFGESNPDFGNTQKLPPYYDGCLIYSFSNVSMPYCTTPHTQRYVTAPQIVDNLTKELGAHTIRAGINFRFYIHNDSRGFFGSNDVAPIDVFSGANRPGNFNNIPAQIGTDTKTAPYSGDITTLQQAIVETAGIPYEILQAFVANFNTNTYTPAKYATVYTRLHQYDSYIEDSWKVRPNVTINAGLRWEYNPAPYDAQQTLVPNAALDGSQGTVSFVKADRWFKNNNIGAVAPRLGVAWSPDAKTSVRAGYALMFDTLSSFQVTAMAGDLPGFMQGCVTTTSGSGTVAATAGCSTASGATNRISTGYPTSISPPITTPSAALTPPAQPYGLAPTVGAFDSNLQNPSVHEWNLTIQRELPWRIVGQIGYVGKRGTHLYRSYNLNQIGINQPGFISSFDIAQANVLAGCNADGTAKGSCTTGQTPTLLMQLGSSSFLNSSTSLSDLQRSNIGNMAQRLDTQTGSSAITAKGFAANYFRENPQFTTIYYQDAGGDSYYHGLFFTVSRRFEKGLLFNFNYTFSKSIDDMSVDPTGATTGTNISQTSFSRTPTDVRNFRLDRAISDYNNTHVLIANMLYDLPFGQGQRFLTKAPKWLDKIIGGWQFTGIYSYQSGEPYTISSGERTENGYHASSALVVGPNDPGHLQSSPSIEGPVMWQTGGLITNVADPHYNCVNVTGSQTYFCIPPPGSNGSSRNLARAPSFWNFDAGLTKNFSITERFKLQFRGEAFNVLNHTNFASPLAASSGSPSIVSTLFGETCCLAVSLPSSANVASGGEPNRVIQFGLKIIF
jgi:hypothetical protein